MNVFLKTEAIVLPNFQNYSLNPVINKYLEDNISEKFEGILILKKNKIIWLSHPFNYNQTKKMFNKKITVLKLNTIDDLKKAVGNVKTIGYHSKYFSVERLINYKKIFKGKKLIDVSIQLDDARKIKTQKEIENISIASKETKKAIKKIKSKLKIGMSEIQVENLFKKEFEQKELKTAFCIIAFGKNTLNLHHVSGKTKLKEGAVLIDVGAKYKGYCADISESFWFGKKETKQKKEYFKKLDFVNNQLKIIENNLKPNTPAKELWIKTSDLKLIHALGHGIGLEEHDYPSSISNYSNWKLEEGMILAIEPAIYSKFGIRIEKDYLITKSGFKEL